jgi:hypothetical protein
MNPKKYLEDLIRGWLPKKPTLPSHQRIRTTRAKNQKSASIRRMKWLAIFGYSIVLVFIWLDYFLKLTGYVTFESALLYTLTAPILTLAGFQVYRIASLKFWQALWTAFGACVFGFFIYAAITFLLNRVLLLTALAEDPFVVIPYVLLSYVIGGYLGYRFGKRRQFRPIGVLV